MKGEGGDESERQEHGRSGRKGRESGFHDFADCAPWVGSAFNDLAGLGLGHTVDAADAAPRNGGEVEGGVAQERDGAEEELTVVELAESGPEQAQCKGGACPAGGGNGQRRGRHGVSVGGRREKHTPRDASNAAAGAQRFARAVGFWIIAAPSVRRNPNGPSRSRVHRRRHTRDTGHRQHPGKCRDP